MATPLTNQDFLGRCYDIVTLDPLDLNKSAKYQNAIEINAAQKTTVQTRDGTYLIPLGVEHKGIFSMSWTNISQTISSRNEFEETFKRSVTANATIPGGFDFSGSANWDEVKKDIQTRKNTFVYSRAYQENHGLELQLDDANAPISLTTHFHDKVAQLPVGAFKDVRDAYRGFVDRFGTHFTTEIILGGLAFQRTIGSVKTYLKSNQTEEKLKISGNAEIDAFKAGLTADQAKIRAQTVDQQNDLRRDSLAFRGGKGAPTATGIDSSWIGSLAELPAVVKATLERLSYLLTPRFFPDDDRIGDKQILLDAAIDAWILEKGKPSRGTAPLRYGEPLAFTLCGGQLPNFGRLGLFVPADPARHESSIKFLPMPKAPMPISGPLGVIVLESASSGREGGAILAGDQVRIRLAGGRYFGQETGVDGGGKPYMWPRMVDQRGQASVITVGFNGDDPNNPARAAEYILETDELQFFPEYPGRGRGWFWIHPHGTGNIAYQIESDLPKATFSLRRASGEQD
jgi:hypothetical protein